MTDESLNELATLIHIRDYPRLGSMVNQLIDEHSWSHIVSLIRKIPVWDMSYYQESYYQHYGEPDCISVRHGVMRDGLLWILGLEHLSGIDVNLLDTFGRFRVDSLTTLRSRVVSKATKILKEQMKRNMTFFLDTYNLSDGPFEGLIPLIHQSRREDIISLEASASINNLAQTYYGFHTLTETMSKYNLQRVNDIAEWPIEHKGKRPSYHRSMFRNYSYHFAQTLINILRLTLSKSLTQKRALDILGYMGDSRYVSALHSLLRKTQDNSIRRLVVWALGGIGHPSSLKHLSTLPRSRNYLCHPSPRYASCSC